MKEDKLFKVFEGNAGKVKEIADAIAVKYDKARKELKITDRLADLTFDNAIQINCHIAEELKNYKNQIKSIRNAIHTFHDKICAELYNDIVKSSNVKLTQKEVDLVMKQEDLYIDIELQRKKIDRIYDLVNDDIKTTESLHYSLKLSYEVRKEGIAGVYFVQ